MARRRIRTYGPNKEFALYSKPTAFVESKHIRRISGEVGEQMVRDYKARQVLDASNILIGYQLYDSPLKPEPIFYVSDRRSSTAFSPAETEAIVGLRGPSRTAGLSELERSKRVANGMPAEDLVETSRNKFAVYKKTH